MRGNGGETALNCVDLYVEIVLFKTGIKNENMHKGAHPTVYAFAFFVEVHQKMKRL